MHCFAQHLTRLFITRDLTAVPTIVKKHMHHMELFVMEVLLVIRASAVSVINLKVAHLENEDAVTTVKQSFASWNINEFNIPLH